MKALKKVKPRALAVTKTQGVKAGTDKNYTIGDRRKNNEFTKLLERLRELIKKSKSGMLWQSQTVFITEIVDNTMYPVINRGALVWVDTAQRPKLDGGIVEGDIYLFKSIAFTKLNKRPYYMARRVQAWNEDGIWGRRYYTDANDEHPTFEPLRSEEDRRRSNKTFIGLIIGMLNPAYIL